MIENYLGVFYMFVLLSNTESLESEVLWLHYHKDQDKSLFSNKQCPKICATDSHSSLCFVDGLHTPITQWTATSANVVFNKSADATDVCKQKLESTPNSYSNLMPTDSRIR
jgi:hypothetical protein